MSTLTATGLETVAVCPEPLNDRTSRTTAAITSASATTAARRAIGERRERRRRGADPNGGGGGGWDARRGAVRGVVACGGGTGADADGYEGAGSGS
jgi:hypothetical protein